MATTPTKLTGDRSRCAACGLLFTSTSSFDKHRTGNYGTGRRCKTSDELRTSGFERFRFNRGRAEGSNFDHPGSNILGECSLPLYLQRTAPTRPSESE